MSAMSGRVAGSDTPGVCIARLGGAGMCPVLASAQASAADKVRAQTLQSGARVVPPSACPAIAEQQVLGRWPLGEVWQVFGGSRNTRAEYAMSGEDAQFLPILPPERPICPRAPGAWHAGQRPQAKPESRLIAPPPPEPLLQEARAPWSLALSFDPRTSSS